MGEEGVNLGSDDATLGQGLHAPITTVIDTLWARDSRRHTLCHIEATVCGQERITGQLRSYLAVAQDEMRQDREHGFAPRTLDTPDSDPTQTDTHVMRVARQAPTSITGGLVLQLETKGYEEGEDALKKRLAIAQQLNVRGFVSKIDGDGPVCAGLFGDLPHGSPRS